MKERVLEEFIPIGRLLLFILVVQPSLNIEAILQEVGQFVAEGAEKFPGFHDPGGAHGILPAIENGDEEPTLTAGMGNDARLGAIFVNGDADWQVAGDQTLQPLQ